LFYTLFFLGQLLFYLLAVTGFYLEKKGVHKVIFYLPLYFCVVNLAALISMFKVLKGENIVTWQTQRWHDSYQVWRSNRPYFEPGDSDSELWQSLTPGQNEELSVVDEGAAGDPNDNTYYLVKALDAESQVVGVSNRLGEYGYALVQGN
jgi:hypothetical protein